MIDLTLFAILLQQGGRPIRHAPGHPPCLLGVLEGLCPVEGDILAIGQRCCSDASQRHDKNGGQDRDALLRPLHVADSAEVMR